MKTCKTILRNVTVGCGAAAVLAGLTAAGSQAAKPGELKIVVVEEINDDRDGVSGGTIEVRIEDGKVSAKRNGKEIPLDQIHLKDGKITIVDEQGQPLDVMIGDGGKFNFGWDVDDGSGLRRFFTGVGAEEGPAPKVMLGVHMSEPGPALNRHLGLEEGKTTMISGVYEGLPAHDAGLEEYDIITEIDGKAPADNATIRKALAEKDAGESVTFTVIHEGRTKDVKVKLQEYDAEKMSQAKLLGSGPQADVWTHLGGDLKKFAVPQWQKDHVFVVPPGQNWEKYWEKAGPQIQDMIKKYGHGQSWTEASTPKGVEERLERLDKRLADLEKMLEKLAEQRGTR
ncbi:MAG: PDZ domain-containing protein [Phycisphaerales bacterium]|nr:PDZ domain-containing protein [Phycisphaerales bacterium]